MTQLVLPDLNPIAIAARKIEKLKARARRHGCSLIVNILYQVQLINY